MTNRKLSESMTPTQFDNGYWYASELKLFANALGIPSASRLRKDELEHAIKDFLRSGRIARRHVAKAPQSVQSQPRDVDLGLRLDRRIVRYTNDSETKEFLEREARKMNTAFRRRSGAMYRLNRWREGQQARSVALTYRALVAEYVRLTQSAGTFAQIPHGRYINFMSDFMADQPGVPKATVIRAWHELKTMDCPKNYREWRKARARKR